MAHGQLQAWAKQAVTKAEATVYNSPLWKKVQERREDHKNSADVSCNIYLRTVNGHRTHRLVCYSLYGDSILWDWDEVGQRWRAPRDIEITYDTVLKELV